MSIIILNDTGSKVSKEKERLLLWTATLLTDDTHFFGLLGIPLDFDRVFGMLNEERKVMATNKVFPMLVNPSNNPRLKDDELLFERNYDRVKFLRKKKRKNRDELLELIKRENFLKLYFGYTIKYFNNVRLENNISDLPKFTGHEEKDIVYVHYFSEVYDEKSVSGYPAAAFTDSIVSDDVLHLFSDEVESLLNESKEGQPYFKAFKLIDLPAVNELKENQIFMLIERLESMKQSFEERFSDTQQKIRDYSFEKDNEEKLAEMIEDGVLKNRDDMQNAIAESIYDTTDIKKEDGYNELYLCVSSYENVIDIYKHLNVFKDELIYSYVKDNVSKAVKLNMSRLFLYLKTK